MITRGTNEPSFGLSTDGKPANVENGHLHVEIDTFKAAMYDEANNEWHEDSGGSSLPDYSEANEGDVLSIDSNGDPAWATPTGGADAFYIRISWDNDAGGGEGAYVTDQSFADILQASDDGKLIFVYDEEANTWTVTVWADDDGISPYVCASFMLFNPIDEAFDYTLYKINQDGVTDSYYRVTTVST